MVIQNLQEVPASIALTIPTMNGGTFVTMTHKGGKRQFESMS